jgi:hypothetical protein
LEVVAVDSGAPLLLCEVKGEGEGRRRMRTAASTTWGGCVIERVGEGFDVEKKGGRVVGSTAVERGVSIVCMYGCTGVER